MTTKLSQATANDSAVPRKVTVSAWAVPVMVLGQFSFLAAVPVTIIVVSILRSALKDLKTGSPLRPAVRITLGKTWTTR